MITTTLVARGRIAAVAYLCMHLPNFDVYIIINTKETFHPVTLGLHKHLQTR